MYLAQDELGHQWVVARGDPAFGLLVTLKRLDAVLPVHVLRSGSLESVDYTRWARAVANLGGWLVHNEEDPEQHMAYVRLITLMQCLGTLRMGGTMETLQPQGGPT